MKVRIATRGSELALTQVRLVSAALRAHTPDLEVEEVPVSTRGDRVTDRPLAALGGKGLFVSEVEAMVATGQADLAVHSLKDVPGDVELAEGMELVCIPARESPFDVLLTRDGRSLGELRSGARVGTTSLRRVAQLAAVRGDLVFDTLRGNVGTRLSRLHEGAFDAIVLAAAGLSRLGLLEREPHVVLDADVCLPAVGQGTLAIEAAGARDDLRRLLAPLEDRSARIETTAERAMLKRLEGSCRVPIAGHARFDAASGRCVRELDAHLPPNATGLDALRGPAREWILQLSRPLPFPETKAPD